MSRTDRARSNRPKREPAAAGRSTSGAPCFGEVRGRRIVIIRDGKFVRRRGGPGTVA